MTLFAALISFPQVSPHSSRHRYHHWLAILRDRRIAPDLVPHLPNDD